MTVSLISFCFNNTESGDADGMKAARFVPVQKTFIIGLSASNLDLSVEEITSAKILEHLVRIHTMLAVVAGRGSDAHSNYCTLAWGFLSRLMQVCYVLNPGSKERMIL